MWLFKLIILDKRIIILLPISLKKKVSIAIFFFLIATNSLFHQGDNFYKFILFKVKVKYSMSLFYCNNLIFFLYYDMQYVSILLSSKNSTL